MFIYNCVESWIAKLTPTSDPSKVPRARSHSQSSCCFSTVEGLIQPSIVMPDPVPIFRLLFPDCTSTYDARPSNEKAWPTSPGSNPAPFINVPLFPPTLSSALSSALHQAVIPVGAGVHDGGLVTMGDTFWQTESVLSYELANTTSGRPSPFRSPITTPFGL